MFTIKDKREMERLELRNPGGTVISLLPNGAIFSLVHKEILVNQVLGSPLEGGMQNLFLRVHGARKVTAVPLLGPGADSEFSVQKGRAAFWQGRTQDLTYTCTLRLDPKRPIWFWIVSVTNAGRRAKKLDVLFSQDLGLAGEFGVRNNEAYTSQYLDHTILRHERSGYLICSRQNQPQGRRFPWIMHGSLQKAVGFLTDGFQFFGPSYKATGVAEVLGRPRLPNRTLQYEFAYPTLQSAPRRLAPGRTVETVFFACYVDSHPKATGRTDLRRLADVRRAWTRAAAKPAEPGRGSRQPKLSSLFNRAPLWSGRDLRPDEIEQTFGPDLRQVEKRGGTTLSFFCGENRYVALQAKERLMDRPHGHILRSGRGLLPNDDTLSSTAYMFGVFHSQVTVGNTNFHKLLSVCRNPLNVLRSSGLRVFVNSAAGFRQLGLASAFETGPQHVRWIYRLEDGVITVRAWASPDDPACFLEVESPGREREFLFSHNLVLGNFEHETGGRVELDAARGQAAFRPAPAEAMAQRYPEARFHLVARDPGQVAELTGDGPLYTDGRARDQAFVTLRTRPTASFALALCGNVLSAAAAAALAGKLAQAFPAHDDAVRAGDEFWRSLTRGARLRPAAGANGAAKLNEILPWYVHNAMVHFTIPHGLEQYSGAAWGLRDVCQGPMEFLMATRQHAAMREVLRNVFSHQYRDTGDWPQWFMVDRYREVQSAESHADIIIWPLKAVCDYLEATGDGSILDEELPFTDDRTFQVTPERAPLRRHIDILLAKIGRDCIPGTALARYGHGDWEDTLQPSDPKLRTRLVSTWTVELIYQTCVRFAFACGRFGDQDRRAAAQAFAERIRRDLNRHLVKDGVVAGLAHFSQGRRVEYFLHPRDRKTGVHYRLLPMTRGIISGIFTPAQARRHAGLVARHLTFPDGARLMDRPLEYYGGTERYFKRAETAANFGREIGLQYVHSHIRYLEAMAKLGLADELFHGLLVVNPIGLNEVVPAAEPRQSNAYFSSSDAAFPDRYQARRQFRRIRTHQVPIKGGWRIYSSGPGIYLNQLISGFLGLREWYDHVLFDPVLPRSLDGLSFEYEYDGKRVTYRYRVRSRTSSPERVTVNGRVLKAAGHAENPYRRGGLLIPRRDYLQALDRGSNLVEIEL